VQPQSSGSSRSVWILVAIMISSFGRMMGACGDSHHRPPQISTIPRYVPTSLPDWGQKNAYFYLRRGDDRKEAGFLDSALEDYDIAIQLDPRIARAYRSRGSIKEAQGDLDAAIADCTKAIELDPEDPIARRYRAASRQAHGDLIGAEADYSKSLRLNPAEGTAWSGRGMVHRARNNFPAALDDFNAALEANPEDVHSWHYRGHIKSDLGDFGGAVQDFTNAMEFNPGLSELSYDRGCARYNSHAWSDALSDFEAAAAKVPSLRDEAHLRMFLLRLRIGRREEAGIMLDQYLLHRKDGDHWSLKSLQFALGRLTEQMYLEYAGMTDPKHACDAGFVMGTMRLLRGDRAGAREMFEKCVLTRRLQDSGYDSARAELLALSAGK
jgi:tetratricopeptide (TPR) repeat protein